MARRNAENHESTVRLLQGLKLHCFLVLFVPKNPFIKQTNTVMLRALLDCYAKVQKTLFSFPFSASICFQSYEQRLSSRENQTNNLQIGFWTEALYKSSVFESSFFYNVAVFKMEKLQRVLFWNENFQQVRFWLKRKQRAVEKVAKTSPVSFNYVNTN